jgi:hypothetical protein
MASTREGGFGARRDFVVAALAHIPGILCFEAIGEAVWKDDAVST